MGQTTTPNFVVTHFDKWIFIFALCVLVQNSLPAEPNDGLNGEHKKVFARRFTTRPGFASKWLNRGSQKASHVSNLLQCGSMKRHLPLCPKGTPQKKPFLCTGRETVLVVGCLVSPSNANRQCLRTHKRCLHAHRDSATTKRWISAI